MFGISARKNGNGAKPSGQALIRVIGLDKSYKTAAGEVAVLRGINWEVQAGEFVGVIGKSGSGKSTLLNMLAGIDRPTAGEVWVGDTPVHRLSEGQMAVWRGRHLGIVFQFFQLLPMLSLVENVMLPMDFCNMYSRRERRQRALDLLDRVGMLEHADKLPLACSGGQQQRVAIARALANDPPVVVADEPTGNLDSKTAESVFALFHQLVAQGKTVIMVTHDSSLAKRVQRTALIADGEIVNEYVARALPTLGYDQMIAATRKLRPLRFAPGAAIVQQHAAGDNFYIVAQGRVDVVLHRPQANDVVVAQLGPGQYFGEIDLLRGGGRTATVRASEMGPVEVVTLDRATFASLLAESEVTRAALEQTAAARVAANLAV